MMRNRIFEDYKLVKESTFVSKQGMYFFLMAPDDCSIGLGCFFRRSPGQKYPLLYFDTQYVLVCVLRFGVLEFRYFSGPITGFIIRQT